MSAFPYGALFGGGNNGLASLGPPSSATSGNADNHSVNIIGGGVNGSYTDLARLLAVTQGPSANGGYSEIFGGADSVPNQLQRPPQISQYLPVIIVGGALLLALVLWK